MLCRPSGAWRWACPGPTVDTVGYSLSPLRGFLLFYASAPRLTSWATLCRPSGAGRCCRVPVPRLIPWATLYRPAGAGWRLIRAGIGQTRLDIFAGQAGVIVQDLGFAPAVGQEIDDKLHRQAGAFDHRLSGQHFRIDVDPILPGHKA